MVWIRAAYFTIKFNCCYAGNYMLRKKAVYENVRILERYIERPIESLDTWANRMAEDTAEEAARIACEELSIRFYGCDVEVVNLRYTEVISVPPRPPAPPIVPRPPIPRYILEQIEYMESRYKEAETVDERMSIRDEINRLKERYGIV